jgi:hypothetical protein
MKIWTIPPSHHPRDPPGGGGQEQIKKRLKDNWGTDPKTLGLGGAAKHIPVVRSGPAVRPEIAYLLNLNGPSYRKAHWKRWGVGGDAPYLSQDPGAAQTPKIDDFRSLKKLVHYPDTAITRHL